MQFQTKTPKQTQKIAADLAAGFKTQGGIITLYGELGAGKTTFVQGFAKALGIENKIISPTFIINRQYPIPNTNRLLHHIDLYRMESPADLATLGLSEIFENPNDVILIEWPEKLFDMPVKTAKQVRIKTLNQDQREITVD